MNATFKKTTMLLALIAGTACAAAPTASVFADTGATTGGANAPTGSTPASSPLHKSGIATWFGPGFYGQKTACGQTLTPAVVGVANRTLPCGTLVKVSYKGHRLTVPVIDRGPYSHIGADWDLTAGAAEALKIEDTVRIGARVVGSVPNTPTLGLRPGSPPGVAAAGAFAGGAVAG